MNYYGLYELNEESMRNVCSYFEKNGKGTAKDAGANGAFMSALVRRGAATIIGKQQGDFFPVGNGLYRRSEANVYVLTIPVADLWASYVRQMHTQGENRKVEAEMMIEGAQRKLDEARVILSKF